MRIGILAEKLGMSRYYDENSSKRIRVLMSELERMLLKIGISSSDMPMALKNTLQRAHSMLKKLAR